MAPQSSHSHHYSAAPATAIVIAAAAVATTAAAYITASIFTSRHQREHDDYEARIAKIEGTRQAERTGRIRAEMKLRSHLKNNDKVAEDDNENGHSGHEKQHAAANKHNLSLQCIGTVVSPYTKRMGTPRQGALVPSGRGYIQLRIPVECVEGLELFSHAWILFTFHANTDTPSSSAKNSQSKGNNGSSSSNNVMLNLSKTKIRPPRGNGIKVGMLATRSPHRPNNIGLSLVKIVRVDKKLKQLHIAALDLVNGTPVYDIKPCVPWDMPGHHDKTPLTVPNWVSQDDELKSVNFTSNATESLEACIRNGKLAPLYTLQNNGLDDATTTICQILAQDPRASNSNGPNKRGSKNNKNDDVYKMVFCSVEIEFRVDGGTNDGVVSVENICDLDLKDVPLHVDGIPILLK